MTAVLDRPLTGSTLVLPGAYYGVMAVEKLSISLDAETLKAARHAAAREGMSLSAWLSHAAGQAAKLSLARAALEEYVAEFGESDPELDRRVSAALDAAGVGRPEPPERTRSRARALARLDGLTEEE